MIEEPLRRGPVAPPGVDVDGDARGHVARAHPYTANAGLQQAGQVLPLSGRVVRLRRRVLIIGSRDLDLPHGPERTPGNLVADLHPIGHGARILERLDRVAAVTLDLPFLSVELEVPPRDRNLLVLRIGSGIRVVDVQEQRRSGGLDPLGQRDRVGKRVVGRFADRRHEYAQPKRRPSVRREYGQLVARLPVLLIGSGGSPETAGRVQRGDVGPQVEWRRLGSRRAGRLRRPARAGRGPALRAATRLPLIRRRATTSDAWLCLRS